MWYANTQFHTPAYKLLRSHLAWWQTYHYSEVMFFFTHWSCHNKFIAWYQAKHESSAAHLTQSIGHVFSLKEFLMVTFFMGNIWTCISICFRPCQNWFRPTQIHTVGRVWGGTMPLGQPASALFISRGGWQHHDALMWVLGQISGDSAVLLLWVPGAMLWSRQGRGSK